MRNGIALFRQNKPADALVQFTEALKEHPEDPTAFAWVGQGLFRIGQPAAAVEAGRRALAIDPCHSMAHDLLAITYNDQYGDWGGADRDSSWVHGLQAAACDTSDGNAWLTVWTNAMVRGDSLREREALHRLVSTGFITETCRAYARWMLRDLPPNAILLTNGDIDTYPTLGIQVSEGFRTDVAIVNLSLLNTDWYRRMVRDRHGLSMPFAPAELDSLEWIGEGDAMISPSIQVVQGWHAMVKDGVFDRPFTIAISVPLEDSLAQSGRVIYGGAYYRMTKDTVDMPVDTTSIRSGLMTIDPMSFRGPMVAANDRGPVRVSGSGIMMRNLIGAALRLDMAYRELGRGSEARAVERWAKGFVAVANCDPETRDIAASLEKMSKSVVTQARKAAKQR